MVIMVFTLHDELTIVIMLFTSHDDFIIRNIPQLWQRLNLSVHF